MAPHPFKPTSLAVALQTAVLLTIAAGLFGILVSDIARHRADVARAEAPSNAQLLSLPGKSDANFR